MDLVLCSCQQQMLPLQQRIAELGLCSCILHGFINISTVFTRHLLAKIFLKVFFLGPGSYLQACRTGTLMFGPWWLEESWLRVPSCLHGECEACPVC